MCKTIAAVLVALAALGLFALRDAKIAHINLLYPPHPDVLVLNPTVPWAVELRRRVLDVALKEFAEVGERALLPEKAYLSKEFQGGVDLAENGTVRKTDWQWALLRGGTRDTCLAAHFPLTMRVLDELPLPVHTAFFSVLHPGRELPPHCGELRSLFRYIVVLSGEKEDEARPLGAMGVYADHEMCLDRMAKACPDDIARREDGKVRTIEYEAGDAILFNDFCCHFASTNLRGPRVALIVNVERDDVPLWKRHLTRVLSNGWMLLYGAKLQGAADVACKQLEGA